MAGEAKKKISEVQDLYAEIHTYHTDDYNVGRLIPLTTVWEEPEETFRGKVILEAGCGGIGSEITKFTRLDPARLYAVDLTRANLEANRRKNRDFKRAEFVQASLLSLPFPGDYFDVVHCKGVVQHLSNPFDGLRELTRVLKPGGKLMISVYSRGGLLSFLSLRLKPVFRRLVNFESSRKAFSLFFSDALLSGILDHLYVPFEYRFTEKEVVDFLSSIGLKDVKRIEHEVDFKKKINPSVRYSSPTGKAWFTYLNPNSSNRLKVPTWVLFGEAGLDIKAVKPARTAPSGKKG